MPVIQEHLPAHRRAIVKLNSHRCPQDIRTLCLSSLLALARYLSSFINKLAFAYFVNNTKTHSDLIGIHPNTQYPNSVRQKKNKPISGNPFPSSQFTAGQQLRRKNPYDKRGGKIQKAKPNIAILLAYNELRRSELASLPLLSSGCTPKRLQDKAMAEPQDFVRGSALLG